MTTRQNPVSIQIPLIPDQVAAVTDLLNRGGNPMLDTAFFPLGNIPTVHFARWIVVPAKDKLPASLVYAGNVDGTPQQHLADLANILTNDLDAILAHCVGYPNKDLRTTDSRIAYLQQHLVKTQGFYVGAPNRSVTQIHQEAKLHNAVRDYVKSKNGAWKTTSEAFTDIKKHVTSDPQWDWAKNGYHLPKKNYFKTILLVLLLLVLLPVLIVFILCIHFFYELRAKPFGKNQNEIPLQHLADLKSQEDIIYQNQLSQVFDTKTGLRRIGLRFFLWATSFAARNWFVEGQLMGTPTIHFARWVLIDGGKRFVFFSNFDGSFDEYLGDFVDNNGWGLNTIYGAAKGYPRTFFMFGKGSYKILEFMGWGRITQVPTQIWYSAYPWYGLQQIVSKSKLRTALFNGAVTSETEKETLLNNI